MSADAPIAPLAEDEPDILCPLCEYNLRGLLEPRCPECGHRSTWEELRSRPPQHPYLFEHHPKRNVWSFFRTFFGSLRPMKFWQNLKPAMPLRTRRLIAFGLICLFFAVFGSGFNALSDIVEMAEKNAIQRKQFAPAGVSPLVVASIIHRYGSFQAYRDRMFPSVTSPQFWTEMWRFGLLRSGKSLDSCRAAAMALLWMPLTIASLLIFRASMRQARIRTGHMLRCVIYTATPLCLFAIYPLAAPLIGFFMGRPGWHYTRFGYVDDLDLFSLVFFLFLAIRLMFAYRLYLRFHFAIATIIASQIIVALVLVEINLILGR